VSPDFQPPVEQAAREVEKLPACENCDCTDENACLDPMTGESCFWVEGFAGHLCSACARRILIFVAERSPGIPEEFGPALRVYYNRCVGAQARIEAEPLVKLVGA
jgi:hypothetical protein